MAETEQTQMGKSQPSSLEHYMNKPKQENMLFISITMKRTA